MKPPKRSLNGLEMSDIIPELGSKETQIMTDAVCNMTKGDFDRLKYIQAVDLITEAEDADYMCDRSLWEVKRILRHRGENRKTEVCCEFKDPNQSQKRVSLFALALQDPTSILVYAKKKKLLGKGPFALLANYCTGDAPSNLVRAFKAKVRPGGPKIKFGVQVPLGVKQALALDKKNGNTKWRDAIKTELSQLEEF